MGNYFVMSTRFNKGSASDFGLIYKDEDTAINPKDESTWIKCSLYNFGWGKENGFYKLPLPNFETLIEIVLNSTDDEDKYGAAAIILENFPDELLCKCESIMDSRFQKTEFKKMIDVFNLKSPINRSPVSGKTYFQIQKDYNRWQTVSEKANTQDKTGFRLFKR